MVVESLIRWGPLVVLLLSLAAHLGHTYGLRHASSVSAEPAAPDSAAVFVREVYRRAVGVLIPYFLCRAFFPQLEQDFGRIDKVATETIRLCGLGLALLGAVWLMATQILVGELWGGILGTGTLPKLASTAPLRVSRNPVLLGLVAKAIGLFLASSAAKKLMALTAIWLGAQLQIRLKEDALQTTYGSDYIDYCKRVRRWL
jgi:protein-S-isoprenylcysteine O-methyltransferase Ste14